MSIMENDLQDKKEIDNVKNCLPFGTDNTEQKFLKESIMNFSYMFGSLVTTKEKTGGLGTTSITGSVF